MKQSQSVTCGLLSLVLLCSFYGIVWSELVVIDNFNKAQGTFDPANPDSDYFFFQAPTNMGLYSANDVDIVQKNSFIRLDSFPFTKDVPLEHSVTYPI